MNFNDKVDEWIKEAEERPVSAATLLKLIANRLRDLTAQNEELLAENISLRDGTKIEEYQKRIVHLEYQLDMLKRRLGGGAEALLAAEATRAQRAPSALLIVYRADGRLIAFNPADAIGEVAHFSGELAVQGEWPRILAVDEDEDLLFLFTSGRVAVGKAGDLRAFEVGAAPAWSDVPFLHAPHSGELLASIMPLSRMPLAEFFLQTSRRGCVKKTMVSMAQTILDAQYIGKGAIQKSDQPFDVALCRKENRHVLVTYEGRLLGLDVAPLSYAVEERIRLRATDFVVASFVLPATSSLLCVTQNGKLIQRDSSVLESSKSGLVKGQSLISDARLAQGTRFVGALPLGAETNERLAVLDAEGRLTVYALREVVGAGTIHPQGGLVLSVGLYPAAQEKQVS